MRKTPFLFIYIRTVLCVGIVGASFASHAMAQFATDYRWQNLTALSSPTPDPRRDGETIYDPVGKRVILFGGAGDRGPLNDVWAFDFNSKTWARLITRGVAPTPRFGFDAVYDPVDHQMVIYSGQGEGFFNDTWALNLNTLEWTDISPDSETQRPKRRYGSGAIFDPQSRSLVSFAGFTSEAGRFQDTQSFGLGAKAWTDWTPTNAKPQVRCLLTAAYDGVARRMIIYGGQRNGPLDDIWAFDLSTRQWTNWTPAERPSGRMWASSFVNREGRFVVFGGSGNGNTNETWEFDPIGRTWARLQIENPPPARNAAMSVYIAAEDRFFVFGGTGDNGNLNDVWELSRRTAAAATVSAASYAGEVLAPESIVVSFGLNLATTTQSADGAPLPTVLAGTTVTIKDSLAVEHPAPLFYVSPTQVNYLIPAGVSIGSSAIKLMSGDGTVTTGTARIDAVSPGLFSANSSGSGAAAAVVLRLRGGGAQIIEPAAIWDPALNRFIAAPIDLGADDEQVYLLLFGSGLRFHGDLSNVSVRVGGLDLQATYAGAQNDFAGLDQINLPLPRSLVGRGDLEITVIVGGRASNSVLINVR